MRVTLREVVLIVVAVVVTLSREPLVRWLRAVANTRVHTVRASDPRGAHDGS